MTSWAGRIGRLPRPPPPTAHCAGAAAPGSLAACSRGMTCRNDRSFLERAAGGDWSVAANWTIIPGNGIGPPPPGPGDSAAFADLASAYTVTVQAGTKASGVGHLALDQHRTAHQGRGV